MKRLLRIGIPSLAAAVVLFAAFHYIRAQGQMSPNAVKAPKALVVPATTGPNVPHVLLATYMNQVLNSGISESAGINQTVDGLVTFKCLLPCTLEIEQSVQAGEVYYTGNYWYIGVFMDGSPLPYGPFQGYLPSDGTWVVGNVNQSISLTPGTHTVQSFVVSYAGLIVEDYHMNYRVYTP